MTRAQQPADADAILQARARSLARRPPAEPDGAVLEVLEFRLADERYAVETRYVGAVHPLRNLTPLPCTPAFVAGVVNLRGHIVPVLDLKACLGLPGQGLADLHRVILIDGGEAEFGLLADAGLGVRRIPQASVQPAPPGPYGAGASYLQGITADRLAVLDMAAILADPRIVVDEPPDGAERPPPD